MSQQRNIKSRRQQPQGFWQRHKAWVDGLTLGQLIRYRIFQVVVALSITIVAVWAAVSVAWSAFVRPPEIPAVEPDIGDSSTVENTDDLDFGGELPNVAKSGRREGVYTFLLVGQDTGGGGNTDTMMLITFDSVNKELYGMSLPRDTMVNVSTSSKRLNAVYNYNKGSNKETQLEKGIAALKKEVGKLTGIVPDFYVVVQWEAVGELVDAIGGVEFDVPFDMDYDDPAQDLHIHIKGGNQVLDGEDAMGLIRWRHNNDFSVQYPTGDLGRVETQQAFLKAVAEECLDPAIILKAPSLAKIFMDNVTTDLSIGNLLAFAQLAADMDAETGVHFVTMPNQDARYPGVSMVLPVYSELLEVLNDGFNPYLDKITVNDIQVLYRNSDGSYSVTSGTLQDSSLARPKGSSSSSGSGGSSQTQKPEQGSGSTTGETGDTSKPSTGEGGNTSTPSAGEGGSTSTPSTGEGGDTSTPSTGEGGNTSTPSTGEGGDTNTPSTGEGGDTSTPSTGEGGDTSTPSTGEGGSTSTPSTGETGSGGEQNTTEEQAPPPLVVDPPPSVDIPSQDIAA